jgi:hypothetical protein
MKLNSGQLLVLGPEGWEPVGDVVEATVSIASAQPLAVQVEVEHWCGDDPEMQPAIVQLGSMRFCSGCGAWLNHPDRHS